MVCYSSYLCSDHFFYPLLVESMCVVIIKDQMKDLDTVLFSKKLKPQQHFFKLGRKYIKHDTTEKYLGLTLDQKLSWRQHSINDKVNTYKGLLPNITH